MSILRGTLETAEHNHQTALLIATRTGEKSDWDLAADYAREVGNLIMLILEDEHPTQKAAPAR